jgi:hypothetical protein
MGKVITIIVLIVVVVGIIIFSTKGGDNQPNSEMTEQNQEMNSGDDSFFGSTKDLIMMGKNVTCDFSRQDENGNIEGTVYVSNQKVRGDFNMTDSSGNNFQTSVINDTEFGYTWGSSPFGSMAIKFAVDEPGTFTEDATANQEQTFNPDEEMNYKCRSWNVDDSKFVPPSDIQFTDFSQQMQQIGDSQCSACEQIPDETAKTQCLQALGC